jgi:hypothetical protein
MIPDNDTARQTINTCICRLIFITRLPPLHPQADVDLLQEHVENITFADVTEEGTASIERVLSV